MRAALVSVAAAMLLGCSPVVHERPVTGAKVSGNVAQGCGDLLARLGRKPTGAHYTGCKSFPKVQAAPVRATYDVAGRDAAAVEAYLIRTTGLNPLKRSCCQWDSAPAGFTDDQGSQFSITMVSDETPVSQRAA